MTNKNAEKGFTLLEILMALVFIALPMAAIIQTTSNYIYDAAYLKEKTIAHWVGMNKLSEMQIAGLWPSAGSSSDGESLLVGEAWPWRYEVLKTPEANMRRIDIEVYAPQDKDAVLSRLTAYIGKP